MREAVMGKGMEKYEAARHGPGLDLLSCLVFCQLDILVYSGFR